MNTRLPALSTLALCLPLLAAACAAISAPVSGPAASATAQAGMAAGKAVYDRYCAVCHGVDGIALASLQTPNLNSQGLLSTVDDTFLRDSIAWGRPGANKAERRGTKMPEFEKLLSADEMSALVRYIRAWQTVPSVTPEAPAVSGDATAGKAVFIAQCAACHGEDGWGEQAPRLAGATFLATASDALIAHTIRYGRPGTRMAAMPLSDTELADVVAFIRTLGEDK